MANNYYNFSPVFVPGTKVRSDEVNVQYSGIENAFALLPAETTSLARGTTYLGVESGAGNDYEVAMPNTRIANANGDRVVFLATHTNTAATTLKVDAVVALALVGSDGNALVANDIVDGLFYEAIFDLASNEFQLMGPTDSYITNAALQVEYAADWATTPEDSLVPGDAGGNGTTDYSSLHWAAKASDSAAAALASEALADADATQTAQDALDTAADALSTGVDAAATAADVVTTAADVVTTNADVVSTNADVVLTAADAANTAQDALDTAADLVDTNQDTLDTAADLVATNQDTIDTDADATAAAASAAAAAISAASINLPTPLTGEATNFLQVNPGETGYLFLDLFGGANVFTDNLTVSAAGGKGFKTISTSGTANRRRALFAMTSSDYAKVELLDDVDAVIAAPLKMFWDAKQVVIGLTLTFDGNDVWHAGNDGSGSALDAGKLAGQTLSSTAGNNTVVQRTGSGYIVCNYLNTTAGGTTNTPTNVWVEIGNDSYHRKQTLNNFRDKILTTASVGSDEIASNAVKQAEISANVVGQSEIKTSTATQSSGSISSDNMKAITLTGGNYVTHVTWNNSAGDSTRNGFVQCAYDGISSYPNNNQFGCGNVNGGTSGTSYVRHYYISASPPYDLGDGDVPLFIQLTVDKVTGEVDAQSISFDPIWAYNGPTNTMPHAWSDDKKTMLVRQPYVNKTLQGRALRGDAGALAEFNARHLEFKNSPGVELTQAIKNADMDIVPHCWPDFDPSTHVCITLDPVSDLVRAMADICLADTNEGMNEVSRIMSVDFKDYFILGDVMDKATRKSPLAAPAAEIRWKLT